MMCVEDVLFTELPLLKTQNMCSITSSIRSFKGLTATIALLAATAATFSSQADEIGDVNVDWLGGDIKVEAFEDPKVGGVTCHVSYFDR